MSQSPYGSGPIRRSGHADIARGLVQRRIAEPLISRLLAPIDERLDLADHRMLIVLKFLYEAGDEFPPELRAEMERSVLGFRYWLDEPGTDDMCHWSESHALLFSVCEHLAGQLFPHQAFTNDGRKGYRKAERGRRRLLEWLGNRFHHGFSEWLSHTYYELDVAGLTLLIDHSQDEELITRAAMVLDLLMLDMALHRFDGRFVASAGRANGVQKARPEHSEINTVLASAFGDKEPAFEPDDVSGIFVARRRYRVPEVIREIADADADHLVRTSQGLDADQVAAVVAARPGLSHAERRDALVELLWSMEAFTTPEAIGVTLDAMHRHDLGNNRYLAALAPFAKLRSERLQVATLRAMNPITQGIAMGRADVQTYRTPHYLLSSAQHHRPGEFGDQEQIWQAALPDDITVFSTHPGSTKLSEHTRPSTPSAWVGNGINPDVGQHRNVLLALHDVRGRKGYLEGRRHQLSHLFFPFVRFDETAISERLVAGRRRDSFIGVLSLNPVEMLSDVEVIQRGVISGWAVVVTDRQEFGSLGRFVDHLKQTSLTWTREELVWSTDLHQYSQRFRGNFCVDGVPQRSDYPRLDCDWAKVERNPCVVTVAGEGRSLVLDWDAGTRTVQPGAVG